MFVVVEDGSILLDSKEILTNYGQYFYLLKTKKPQKEETHTHPSIIEVELLLRLTSRCLVVWICVFAVNNQPLGNQELWKFVHSVYGTELGFSSNDEAPSSSSIVVVGDGCVSASAGETSPLSDAIQPSLISLQQQQQQQQNSSPSPSLHSAQTSNDDDSGVHHPVANNRHHRHHHHHHHHHSQRHFNQLNSRRHQQVGQLQPLSLSFALSLFVSFFFFRFPLFLGCRCCCHLHVCYCHSSTASEPRDDWRFVRFSFRFLLLFLADVRWS